MSHHVSRRLGITLTTAMLILTGLSFGQSLYDPTDIATVEFSVYDPGGGLLIETGPFNWDPPVWVVAPIAPGDERSVVAIARDASGNGLYWGELGGVTVVPDVLYDLQGALLMNAVAEGIMVITPPFSLVGLITLIPFQLEVVLDVKPGSEKNPINVNSKGKTPAAILGTADFDVTTIDPDSLLLAGSVPVRVHVEDCCTYVEDEESEEISVKGPDGIPDLVLHFSTRDLAEALEAYPDGESAPVVLTGNLLDGTMIEGVDMVTIIRKTH